MKRKLRIIEKNKVRWENEPKVSRNKMFSEQTNMAKNSLQQRTQRQGSQICSRPDSLIT
jgi:hypothetical protein